MARVDLGFPEYCEPWELESRLFPSKIGGKPAWLDLEKLPTPEDLQCPECKQQMVFLIQIYAPYEQDESNFHRTLFVFICRNEKCCVSNSSSNVKAFRSTMKRINKFYSSEPPKEQPDPTFSLSKFVRLCETCGCLALKQCSKCKKVWYCSREHQVIDWKEKHKYSCCGVAVNGYSSQLFPELNLIREEEIQTDNEVDEAKELEKYEQLKEEGKVGTMSEIADLELEQYAAIDGDKMFSKFKKRIENDPDQVIRYNRGGQPLWITDKSPVPNDIPNCELCGSPRQFEFQIMPQMISVLKEEKLDWGIITIYTCKKSCTGYGSGYKPEFVFKQDITSGDS